MKHVWSILCQQSSIDQETNLISLFNAIEELNINLDKANALENNLLISVQLQLVSYWVREEALAEETLTIRTELVNPEGKVLNSFDNKLIIKSGILRFRHRNNIQGLTISGPGRYHLRVVEIKASKEMILTELPLDVKVSYKIMDLPKS